MSIGSWMEKISQKITESLEGFFYSWGLNIGRRPWLFILACLLFTLVSSLGLFRFRMENRPDKLWIPTNSDFLRDTDWLKENFPAPLRIHNAIITGEDILTPKSIQFLLDLHLRIRNISNKHNKTYADLCFKLPVTKFNFNQKRKKRSEDWDDDEFFDDDKWNKINSNKSLDREFEPSVDAPVALYCDILNNLPEECWENNPGEIWAYDSRVIQSLTKEEILTKINSNTISPIFGRPLNYTSELGEVTKDSNGNITRAGAVLLRWVGRINYTEAVMSNDLGTGEIVDFNNLEWEKLLIEEFSTFPVPSDMSMYYRVTRSFGDISNSTIMGDSGMLAIGFGIVFIYVIFMLGKFNMVEQRPYLSFVGLTCIALALFVSYGLCSLFGFAYGPVHNILPFLLLGIGIDDMFVIMGSWNNLPESSAKLPLEQRIGLVLKDSGVSITITSLTDFIAFIIGSTTVLPALQSFCVYAAFGILVTYIFQATFFTAFLTLDVKRIENNRNGFVICYTHKPNYVKNSCSKRNLAQEILGGLYSDIILYKPIKFAILLLTLTMAGFGIWGNRMLRQEFDPMWFLPQDSYLFQYHMARERYFPGMGFESLIVFGNISLRTQLQEIDSLLYQLDKSPYVYEVDAWYPHFKTYANKYFNKDIPNTIPPASEFNKILSKFLFSAIGSRYRGRFLFDGNLECGRKLPYVKGSMLTFKFNTFMGPHEHIPAMHAVKDLITTNFPIQDSNSKVFCWSMAFATWETDEIITVELYRNMGLALISVLITTLCLIANIRICFMVLTCVILTLLNVLGGMYFWNLTIDTVSCVDLVLSIGLCVDYAAHIGHCFMTVHGSRDERVRKSLKNIGPAVLNGGISTFLAFVLCANSRSHVFITFFKIFFMVVLFGLYHGLVFLPVILSLIGPNPYRVKISQSNGHGHQPEVVTS